MKKMLWFVAAVVVLFCSFAFAQEAEITTAAMGKTTFAFTNEQEFYDLTYKYPDQFELEIKEETDRTRHLLRYHLEGYDPSAVGLVVARNKNYSTAEERLKDVAFLDEFSSEEINGISWDLGWSKDQSENRVLIYATKVGEYIYTFSFSTDYPKDFDFTELAASWIGEITVPQAGQ